MKQVFAILLFVFVSASSLLAQDDYFEKLNNAKLHIANKKLEQAVPLLQQLHKTDPVNANICYMLGSCYIKLGIELEEAIKLLKYASEFYTPDFDYTSIEERRAPEYVFYYLLVAYSQYGLCEQCLKSLNDFYMIYSYEDEWYLIDGQEWYRECSIREKDKTEEELLAALGFKSPEAKKPLVDQLQAINDGEYKLKGKTFEEHLINVNALKGIGTKSVEYSTKSSMFGVQVGALLQAKYTSNFKDLKNVDVYMDRNGVFRYVVGKFLFKNQAERLLEDIKALGYTDAFVVDINHNNVYKNAVITIENESINRKLEGKIDYTVQIGAYRTEVPEYMARIYLKIEDIEEHVQDSLTILTVGHFESYDAASNYRNDLKMLGVNDAFVVAFNQGKKIPLDEAIQYTKASATKND